MDPAPSWPTPQSPAETHHHRARLPNAPSSPRRDSSAERYRTRGFADGGSHDSFAMGSSRDSRDASDANLKVRELCDLFSHILEKNQVHAAQLLLGEMTISSIANADINWSKSEFNRQIGDFIDRHKSDSIRGTSDTVQRASSQASAGRSEPAAPDRRTLSPEPSAPGSSSVKQNPVSRMFRFARSLSRAARRCTGSTSTSQTTSFNSTSQSTSFDSTSQSTTPSSTLQSTSPSASWQIDTNPGSSQGPGPSQGEQRSRGDVNSGDETRALGRTFTFEAVVPEEPSTEPKVNRQPRDGARRGEGHSQFPWHVTADRGHRGTRERVPGERASSRSGDVRSDNREQVSRRTSANQRAESSDQARKARQRSSGGGSKSSSMSAFEPSGGVSRWSRKTRVMPGDEVVPSGRSGRDAGCDAGSDECAHQARNNRD